MDWRSHQGNGLTGWATQWRSMVLNKEWQITLLYKRDGDDITLLIVHVDDMIVISSNFIKIDKLWSYLAKEFEMKNFGYYKILLGYWGILVQATTLSLITKVYIRSFGWKW